MKKKEIFGSKLFIILFVVFLSSCVQHKDIIYLNDQILALNKRVKKIQESQESMDGRVGSDLNSRLKSIHSGQAEVRVELDQVKREVQGLSGRVEDNEHIIKRSVERDLTEQDEIKTNLAEVSEKVKELDVMVKQIHQYVGIEPSTVRVEGKKAAVEQKEIAIKPPEVVEKPKSRELELYDTSLALYREGKFEQAMEGYKNFLRKYPQSDLADNAQFWIGECHMAMKQYEQAILAYQVVIKKHPKGNKVPNAMLRQAIAFWEIKDKTSFRLLLKKIISKYPKSSEAEIARQKLKRSR